MRQDSGARLAAAITDHGGRTSLAAIVSRELGLPAIVGTGNASVTLASGRDVTVSCAEGDTGYVYDEFGEFEVHDLTLERIPSTRRKVMLNMATPAAATRRLRLPADGIGLALVEFIINNIIKIYPMALIKFEELEDNTARRQILQLTHGFRDKTKYFVDTLAERITRIAASRDPCPVIVRVSDFKTNAYAQLIGACQFEPKEENPILG